jgi:F0F1-type ATP synthase epsilon subunit
MSEGTFQLKVYSGRGLEVEASVAAVTVPGEGGELGFLPNHCDYVGLLSTGLVEYATTTDATPRRCVVSGGVCTFNNNVLTLLADTVDLPDALDLAPLSEDVGLLEAELEALSLFDPERELLAQRVARIHALRNLAQQ